MNPLQWSKQHQAALLLAIAIGGVFGILLGYVFYALGYGSGAVSFGYWISQPVRGNVAEWGLFGGAVGAATIFVIRLMRSDR